ncbi:hypothetical protein HHI36_022089 [Cryptolaemus montrouzieri]|uniref:CCHC-type domain-containing protein n=1 Tax=Cryptolaemus montrouzieri TaxID=559131 RepID=A0ABD2MZ15_9CUCU
MKTDIPSYITIENETSLMTYKGPRTCRLCDNPNHEMRDCPAKPENRMKLIVPGNETEPEVIKKNVNYSNAGNMEEKISQEPESGADDEEPKIDSITEEVLNERIETDTSSQNYSDIVESSQTILTDAFKLPLVKKEKQEQKT